MTERLQKETPAGFPAGALILIRQCPTLPWIITHSTIGAEGLNFRVRNGIGCDPLATTTGNLMNAIKYRMRPLHIQDARNYKHPENGQAERPISTG